MEGESRQESVPGEGEDSKGSSDPNPPPGDPEVNELQDKVNEL